MVAAQNGTAVLDSDGHTVTFIPAAGYFGPATFEYQADDGYNTSAPATVSVTVPISVEEGTGMVHVAPGQGAEDYRLGKKEKLPMIDLIDDEAFYLDEMNEFSGAKRQETSGNHHRIS